MKFRELEFPLKDIKDILNSSHFDRNKALEQQIELLTLKREHIDNLITFARGIKTIGVKKYQEGRILLFLSPEGKRRSGWEGM